MEKRIFIVAEKENTCQCNNCKCQPPRQFSITGNFPEMDISELKGFSDELRQTFELILPYGCDVTSWKEENIIVSNEQLARLFLNS